MRILITGASGFVGRALIPRLLSAGHALRATSRTDPFTSGIEGFLPIDIGPETNWRTALEGVHAVVHLAARVHQLSDSASDPLPAYRAINALGTLNLAEQAAQAGVKRFVFMSTAKVWGERSGDRPFDETSPARAEDPYGISKWEAEVGLQHIAQKTGMDYVTLRPPLVYGPGVKANFLRLMRWIDRGYPLPFAAIHNRRSLIGLGNVIDAIAASIDSPAAANQTFGVADDASISTPDLIRCLATQLHRPTRLFPISPTLLRYAARCARREAEIARLTENLEVDISRIQQSLNWHPPYSLQSCIEETVSWYRAQQDT